MSGPVSEPGGRWEGPRDILEVTRQQTVAPSHPRPTAGCGPEAVGNVWEVWGGVVGRAAGTPLLLHRPVSSGPGTAANPCSSARRWTPPCGSTPSPSSRWASSRPLATLRSPVWPRSWSVETKVGVWPGLQLIPAASDPSLLWPPAQLSHLGNGSGNSSLLELLGNVPSIFPGMQPEQFKVVAVTIPGACPGRGVWWDSMDLALAWSWPSQVLGSGWHTWGALGRGEWEMVRCPGLQSHRRTLLPRSGGHGWGEHHCG